MEVNFGLQTLSHVDFNLMGFISAFPVLYYLF